MLDVFFSVVVFPMVKYLQQQGMLPVGRRCPDCRAQMSLISNASKVDGCQWRCHAKVRILYKKTRVYRKTVSVRDLTWFSGSHLSCCKSSSWLTIGGWGKNTYLHYLQLRLHYLHFYLQFTYKFYIMLILNVLYLFWELICLELDRMLCTRTGLGEEHPTWVSRVFGHVEGLR